MAVALLVTQKAILSNLNLFASVSIWNVDKLFLEERSKYIRSPVLWFPVTHAFPHQVCPGYNNFFLSVHSNHTTKINHCALCCHRQRDESATA